MQNFITIQLENMQSGLPSIHSITFLGSESDNSYPQGRCADFDAQYAKRRFAQGCAFWGPENEMLLFDPISPKTEIFCRFLMGRKFRRKTGFNIGDLNRQFQARTSQHKNSNVSESINLM